MSIQQKEERFKCLRCGCEYASEERAGECKLQGDFIDHVRKVWSPGLLLIFGGGIWPALDLNITKDKSCLFRAFFRCMVAGNSNDLTVTRYDQRWLAAEAISITEAVKQGWRVPFPKIWQEQAPISMQDEYLDAIKGVVDFMPLWQQRSLAVEHLAFCED